MTNEVPGRQGYRAYWAVNGLLATGLVTAGITLDNIRNNMALSRGQDLSAIGWWPAAIALAACLMLWLLSGITAFITARRILRSSPGTVVLFAQRTKGLESALSFLIEGDVSWPFYFVFTATRHALSVYSQGKLVIEIPSDRIKTIYESSTIFRRFDVPCVAVVVDISGTDHTIAFMAAASPWLALFPTNPSRAEEFSKGLNELIAR